MTDINPKALALARINCGAAGVTAEALQGRNLASVSGAVDVAMANPPYITDAAHRLYRDGGGMHGAEISMEMARAAVERLAPERSEEHTSELQSLMRISYAVFCLT